MENIETEIYPKLREYIENLNVNYSIISESRKSQLEQIAEYLSELISKGKDINIIFICTHNSRRSHIAQLWAWAASYYFGIPNVNTFSGGTEATAFNHRSVKAMTKAGFEINEIEVGGNPVFECSLSESGEKIKSFSKEFSHSSNPQSDFIAVMVCSDADEACPFVPGAAKRFSLPYDDPKKFENTDLEEIKYDAATMLIATEIFYMFSKIKN